MSSPEPPIDTHAIFACSAGLDRRAVTCSHYTVPLPRRSLGTAWSPLPRDARQPPTSPLCRTSGVIHTGWRLLGLASSAPSSCALQLPPCLSVAWGPFLFISGQCSLASRAVGRLGVKASRFSPSVTSAVGFLWIFFIELKSLSSRKLSS